MLGIVVTLLAAATTDAHESPELSDDSNWNAVAKFLSDHCLDCHQGADAEAGLDLAGSLEKQNLVTDLGENFNEWVTLHDRVKRGEMPPESSLEGEQVESFLNSLGETLRRVEDATTQKEGRAVWRRMNRYEYENTLRDLLNAPWLQIRTMLPEDGESHLFNKVGTSLDTSHVQIARYLQAAQYALRQVVIGQAEEPKSETVRYYARRQPAFAQRLRYNPFNRSPSRAVFPLLDHEADLSVLQDEEAPPSLADSDPSRLEREAFGVVASSYEPLELRFDEFEAQAPGRYKLRFRSYTFWAGPGKGNKWWRPDREVATIGRTHEPVTIYAQSPPRLLRRLGAFDVAPMPSIQELDVYLLAGETIRPDAARLFRSRPPNWHNPLAEEDGLPGVAFYWMEAEGPIHEQWPPAGHHLLFDHLEVVESAANALSDFPIDVVSANPRKDARRLLQRFMSRAYRRPVDPVDVDGLFTVVEHALDSEGTLVEALLAGYAAVLCSPEFVSMREEPGPLGDHELATRLSYFLWNTEPDSRLRKSSHQHELSDRKQLLAEVDRMIDSPEVERFVNAFLAYWLELRRVSETSPDEVLYSDYYLDDLLVESAASETRRFFLELLRENLDVGLLIDSDFAFVNQALAAHYGFPEVEGVGLRQVAIPADSPRGGVLTQASVLKITADGTNTSPVKRGAWVMERLLGRKPSPPPPSVPGLEPDTRGAETIREQLAKHRELESCNRCHRDIDPVGFALESFDVLGGWREQYRTLNEERGTSVEGYGKNGQPFQFRLDQPVDTSGELPDGRKFANIIELKKMLLEDRRQLARNLVRQLLVYSTGAEPRFSDRIEIERILDEARAENEEGQERYPVRNLVRQIVVSPLFTMK